MSQATGFAIFCEDIRDETRGTETLVGVLAGGIVVPSIPFKFHKLGVYARVEFPPKWSFGPVSCFLELPDGATFLVGTVDEERFAKHEALPEAQRGSLGVIMVSVKGCDLTKTGLLRVILRYQDKEQTLGHLEVALQE